MIDRLFNAIDRGIDWLFQDDPMSWWKMAIIITVMLGIAGLGIWLFKISVQFFARCDC